MRENMKKVTVEITKDKYTVTYHDGDNQYTKTMKATPYGASGDISFEAHEAISDELYYALESLDSGSYDVMKALQTDGEEE
jgi:hypothetical protein